MYTHIIGAGAVARPPLRGAAGGEGAREHRIMKQSQLVVLDK